ncbi:putative Zn(2)-C6 fungal-type domain-containing protein [Seiridium cardinale]
MASPSPAGRRGPHKYACSLCARRKVKCNKDDPCSNCLKAKKECLYEIPAAQRPRKRAADEDLTTRLAIYEDLMRQHNLDFSRYTHTWVPSLSNSSFDESHHNSPMSVKSATTRPDYEVGLSENMTTEVESLTSCGKLKYPPIQSLRRKDDPLWHPTPPLQFAYPSDLPELRELHPQPRNIFRFWQIFVDKVHPITKIVHAPTLQQRILEASWDIPKASKSLTAIMFAIYTLAITPMTSDDCKTSFGESRDILLMRYRAATVQALLAAEFLTTKELEVLQALVLFLLADPESEMTCVLAGSAMKIGQRMGLYRENTNPRMPFFEKEMRIRLWWQLRCIDSRSGTLCTPGTSPPLESEFGDIRLPLNVNDVDLHPDMVDPPIEHDGPTEMLCVLLKFEVFNWLRHSLKASKVFDNIIHGPARNKMSVSLQDGKDAIDELEELYQTKYIRNCDEHIPLHGLTHTIANLSLARMRFKIHHPRWRAAADGGEIHMTREESDMLFNSAVDSLHFVDVGLRSKFSSHLFTHMTFRFQLDAYIYVISDMRRRSCGDRVAIAWNLVEQLYNENPELINDDDNTFFIALGDLTLEAWETRRKELVDGQSARKFDLMPQFIQLLWDKREDRDVNLIQIPSGLDVLGLADNVDLNWEYWNDFLQL